MYYLKQLDEMVKVNGKTYAKIKRNLFLNLFLERESNNCDDSEIIQRIIDHGYLTKEEILAQVDAPILYKLPHAYSLIIKAVVAKAIENSDVEDILFKYFGEKIFSPKRSYRDVKFTKKLVAKFLKGKLNKEEGCWIALLLLREANEADFQTLSKIQDICRKYDIYNNLVDAKQCNLLETISDILGYDIAQKKEIAERFVFKRTGELYEYLCQRAHIEMKDTNNIDVSTLICASAVGMSRKPLFCHYNNMELKRAGFFKNTDKPIAADMNIDCIGPMGKICFSAENDMAASMFPSDFGMMFYYETFLTRAVMSFENQEFITNAILEYLLDTLSDAYFSEDKTAYDYTQIVRMLSYSETDCRIVLEKIAANIHFFIVAKRLKRTELEIIDNADFTNVRSLKGADKNCKEPSNKSEKGLPSTATIKALEQCLSDLSEEKQKNSRLADENQQLKEQLLALQEQLNRKNNQNQVIKELKEKIDVLNDENESLSLRIDRITEKNKRKNQLTAADKTPEKFEVEDSFFADKKLIFVGGRWEINRKLAALMPKSRFVEQPTDVLLNVKKYEAVVFFTDFNNHAIYSKYIKQCRINNASVLYLTGSSMNSIKQKLYNFLQWEKTMVG